MVPFSGKDRAWTEWAEGIRTSVPGRKGHMSNTGRREQAARLLSDLGFSESTLNTRTSQVAKWLRFCDEEMRKALQADEGDVKEYLGYL